MATPRSQPLPSDRHSLAELTLHEAHADLLDVEPLDLGPDAPATTALEHERGPRSNGVSPRGDE